MSTTTAMERDPLRAAILRDAARLVDARDVLLVRAPGLDDVQLTEALICGDHWQTPVPLELVREPLLLRALTGRRVLRCCPRRPRRVCGPFWATSATLVPHEAADAPFVVIFGGGTAQPADGLAHEAAAMVFVAAGSAAPSPARHDGDGLGSSGVVLARGPGVADPAVLARVTAAVAGIADAAPHVLRTDGGELCLLIPCADARSCERTAAAVRRALRRVGGGAVATGWALAGAGEPLARAVEVARAMARQDERRERSDAR